FINAKVKTEVAPVEQKQRANTWLLGLLTSLTNPKVIVFYASIFTLAIEQNTAFGAKLSLPFLCALTSLLWYGFVAVILSVPKFRMRYQKWGKALDRGMGIVLLIFGAKLVFSGKS